MEAMKPEIEAEFAIADVYTISSVLAMHPGRSQIAQINGIKAEVEVLRLAVK